MLHAAVRKRSAVHAVAAALMLMVAIASGAHAGVTQAVLDDVAVEPPPDAAVPPDLQFLDEHAQPRRFADILDGKPAVVVFTDYTCRTLCGPLLSFAAAGLERSGLAPGADFRLIVVGLDPRDDLQSARDLKAARIGSGDALADATVMLKGETSAIAAAAAALGYHYAYDAEHDQFAHPAAAFVVTPAGRVSRVLSALGLDASDLRLALVEAGAGRVGSLGDRLRLLCYGFDAVRGIYTETITLWLELAAIATMAIMAAGVAVMNAASRRRAAPAAAVPAGDPDRVAQARDAS